MTPGERSPAQIIRDWMRGVLKDRDLSPAAWAKAAGVAPSTVQRAIKDDYSFVTSSRTLAKLASAANATPPDALTFASRPDGTAQVPATFLPVRYQVQAGSWLETDEVGQTVRAEYPVAPHPQFAAFPQWLEEVVGESIDLKIPPGAFAHVVDAIALGYAARNGDFVVVERRRSGLRERTIKEVVITPQGQVQLWGRSTNPRWNEPVAMTDGTRNGHDIEIEIVGYVIGAYRPF